MEITVIGIGPGGPDTITPQAREAILAADTVVGYNVYLDLVRNLTTGKDLFGTAMRQEVDRCRIALAEAQHGRRVAFVCSGDAGVYGMAGIMAEVAEGSGVPVHVVPGVTAACSGAAVLGAPLMHDFCVLSLSDLLTPRELIERRLDLAAQGDFVLCLYNPRSRKRPDHLRRACERIAAVQSWDLVCGWVKNIGRPGEESRVCTLRELAACEDVDMFTTVFIGNSRTRVVDGKMVTPRGYRDV